MKLIKTTALLIFIGLVYGGAFYGFMKPEYVRIPLELPEREEIKVDWGEPCITSGTLKCKEYRRKHGRQIQYSR